MLQINEPKAENGIPLLSLGFRPFFLFAGLFAVISMALWSLVYRGWLALPLETITAMQWHAHEMIYGYSLAVIAGFLLTAVKNWTQLQTPFGSRLGFMAVTWVAARVAFAFGETLLITGALLNLLFIAGLFYAVASRVIKVQQWRQAPILVVLALFIMGELLFLIGLVRSDFGLLHQAVYLGFYLVLLLILIMGRRVIPFFIERGVGYPVTLRQSLVLDILTVAAVALYGLNALIIHQPMLFTFSAGLAFATNSIRLFNWHTSGIWQKPLLWSLYLAFAAITLGFLLAALVPVFQLNGYLAIHAWAVGGVGLITLSMMARVSLGHTGREIYRHPTGVTWALVLMALALVARVLLPLVLPSLNLLWVGLSQLLWIAAFVLFVVLYAPLLCRPRVDGQPG